MNNLVLSKHQQGAVTLLTAVILLISITLVALLTAKTVIVETQITADNYRISQATAAASAAMDRGVAYFMENGFDADGNNVVDYVDNNVEPTASGCSQKTTTINSTAFNFANNSTGQTTLAQFFFDNTNDGANPNDNLCPATTPNMKRGYIIAKGWSDDCVSQRTISQCVGTVDIFKGGTGPDQAWVSKSGLGVNGTGTMINRYTNTNVWTGGGYGGPSAAYDTYIRPSDKEVADFTTAQLDAIPTTQGAPVTDAVQVSGNKAGNGFDIISNDAFLASLTSSTLAADMTSKVENRFFDMYFSETKKGVKQMAINADQLIPFNGTIDSDASGVVWVGNADDSVGSSDSFTLNQDLGTPTKPVILIVNGNLEIKQSNFYGVIYVTGNISGTGTGSGNAIHGSLVAEKTNATNSMSANTTLIYKPWGGGGDDSSSFLKGTGTVIAGTWQDWINW